MCGSYLGCVCVTVNGPNHQDHCQHTGMVQLSILAVALLTAKELRLPMAAVSEFMCYLSSYVAFEVFSKA